MEQQKPIVISIAIFGACILFSSCMSSVQTAITYKSPSPSPSPSPSSYTINSIGYVIDITKTYYNNPISIATPQISLVVNTSTNTIVISTTYNNVFSSLVLNFIDPNDGTSLTIVEKSPGSTSPGSTSPGSTNPALTSINSGLVLGFLSSSSTSPISINNITYALTDGLNTITVVGVKFTA